MNIGLSIHNIMIYGYMQIKKVKLLLISANRENHSLIIPYYIYLGNTCLK